MTVNQRAHDLWGLPDDHGRFLARVIEFGDDASEDDYTMAAMMANGAVRQAANAYASDVGRRGADEPYRLLTGRHDDPLIAELADGTLIAVITAGRRGPGWYRPSRPPTPQEHARWAGLAIPEVPPPAQSAFDRLWGQLARHAGEDFHTRRGLLFTYSSHPWNLWVTKPNGTGTSLARGMLYAGFEAWPVKGPTALPVECGHSQRSFIWALLADPRIHGLTTQGLVP